MNTMVKLGALVAVVGFAMTLGGCAVAVSPEPAPTVEKTTDGKVGTETTKGGITINEPPPAPSCPDGEDAVWDSTDDQWFCKKNIKGVCTSQCTVAPVGGGGGTAAQ